MILSRVDPMINDVGHPKRIWAVRQLWADVWERSANEVAGIMAKGSATIVILILRDDDPSSSSSQGTQSSTPASTVSPPHPPQQHFPQQPYQYLGYIVYSIPLPPPHTGAAVSSSSSTVVPPFALHFPYLYPYPPYHFPPPPPPS
ncbi:hypothetical protein PIB30_001630 [Stylosanthes scabra]|uniref:Uncharacterized protein n=1 Tax=Stylosanthes scabra TaxID=79078 RepID=A0ABU6T4F9_9FABA|nr:hypothetical protein [Stylosanthes scabra]